MTRTQLRKRNQDRAGIAIVAAVALSFSGLLYGAARIDAANGITPAESMCNNGFSGFCVSERPAVPARLIGQCGGRILAAMEESAFPAGCNWIEPIRTEEGVN